MIVRRERPSRLAQSQNARVAGDLESILTVMLAALGLVVVFGVYAARRSGR